MDQVVPEEERRKLGRAESVLVADSRTSVANGKGNCYRRGVPKYHYDPGVGRFKHRWKNDYAGFDGIIGKCPSGLGVEKAQQLLDDGIPYFSDPSGARSPDAIYNVYKGVPYEAAPTEQGKSFHGFPWRGRMPKRILRQLEERAENANFGREFRDWIRKYGSQ